MRRASSAQRCRLLAGDELPGGVDDPLAAVDENGGGGAGGGRDDVVVHGGLVEAQVLPLLLAEAREIAGVGVADREPQGDVGVAELAARVLVEQGVGHEVPDWR